MQPTGAPPTLDTGTSLLLLQETHDTLCCSRQVGRRATFQGMAAERNPVINCMAYRAGTRPAFHDQATWLGHLTYGAHRTSQINDLGKDEAGLAPCILRLLRGSYNKHSWSAHARRVG